MISRFDARLSGEKKRASMIAERLRSQNADAVAVDERVDEKFDLSVR